MFIFDYGWLVVVFSFVVMVIGLGVGVVVIWFVGSVFCLLVEIIVVIG